MRRSRTVAIALLGLVLTSPAGAASGTVHDPNGEPVVGARACLVVESSEIFCANTDEKGAYALMDSPLAVRISAKGFYRKTVTPADHEAPIVLEWAAVLHVIVVDDRTGRSVSTSEVQVTYESGARLGPFAADGDGLRIATTPGQVVVSATASGYESGASATLDLKLKDEVNVEVRLRPNESS